MTPRYPWATFAEDWDLQIAELRIASAMTPIIDRDAKRVNLVGMDDWSTMSLQFLLRTSQPRLVDGPTLDAYVLVSSPRTSLRLPVGLVSSGQRTFAGSVELSRNQLAGQVEIVGEIVGVVGGIHRRLGTSAPWTVVIEAATAPKPPGAPPFPMTWTDFTVDSAPQMLREHPGAYSMMDLSSDPIVLYLNNGIPGLQALLTADNAQKEKRRLRDIIGTRVARDAASALFRAAAAEIVAPDDQAAVPTDRLQREICEAVAAEMDQVSGVDELYERLYDAEAQGGSVRGVLWMHIDAALDSITNVEQAVARAAEEVKYA